MKKKSTTAYYLKNTLTGFLLVFISLQISAQSITNYTFAASSGTFTALSGATAPALTGTTDEGVFTALPIGFDFWYMGTRYTTVSASTNGWLALGSTIANDYVNGLSSRGTRPLIAPLWDDLDISAASNVTYKTTGTAGSRVFTLEYLNARWNYLASSSVISFQVQLYEGTGKIVFVYRSESLAANAPSASVGIAASGTGTGNFLSINSAGSIISSTTEANVVTKPATGKTYGLTPPVPAAPSALTFSNGTSTSMTLNWVDNSSNETGFVIYRSTDGLNYSFVSQTAANALSSVQSGLTTNTTYYWKIYAVSEGGLSTAISGTRATTCTTPPAAPTVTTPVTYCQNATATQLTATGSNLTWGNGSIAGSAGGATALTSAVYVDNSFNNRKTNFTTTAVNVTITTVDFYIPAYQAVTGIVLALYNNVGAVIATSGTTTTLSNGATAVKVSNSFNYSIAAQGNYSIGIYAGSGNIGYDNPSFPVTESSGTINITGTSPAGSRCFNNIQFTVNNGSIAPTPYTATAGTTNYLVSQTVSGCLSPQATIAVVVNPIPSAVISYTGSPFCKSAGVQAVTATGTTGGTYSSTAGLSINAATGAITPASSTAGTYTVTYTIAASGGCAVYSTTTSVTITNAPAATISYSGSPYCTSAGMAAVSFSGTTGGVYSSTAGLVINTTTGEVNLNTSSSGTYTVTYTIAASGGCALYTTTTNLTINTTPVISQLPATGLIAYYKFGGNANDAAGNDPGTLQNNPTPAADRFGVANSAYLFNGSSNYVTTANSYVNPLEFTISIWFKTSSVTGGKLIGFGNSATGQSGQYDRHIYMNNAGQLYFGVYSSGTFTVNSALSYNDNNWHLVTGSLSSTTGMVLYVDGVSVASNPSATAAENSTGYWRIGFDNLGGWPSSMSGYYFNGILDDAVIYHRSLTASEVGILYGSPDGAGNNGPVCAGTSLLLSGATASGATYAWTGPNSFTSSSSSPSLTYAITAAGTYRLQVTTGGCTATAYTNVVSSGNAGQWTGSVSTDWANAGNWCTGIVPGATTNVTIGAGAARMPSIISGVTCNNLTIDAGATLTTSGAGTLNIAGTLTNNGTFSSSGTVNFNGVTGQQTFTGVSQFYNLTVANAGGLLLSSGITVNNTLTINSGTLNTNDFNITVRGNWTNNSSTAALAAGLSRVSFNGSAPQSIGGSFSTTFNDLRLADTVSTVTLLVNTIVGGNLSVTAGIFDLAGFTANRASAGGVLQVANNATLKIGGTNTFPANYTTISLPVASTVVYSGVNQTVSNQVYGNLTLSSASGAAVKTMPSTALDVTGNLTTLPGTGTAVSFTAAANIAVDGNVTIGAGTTFNGGNYTDTIGGNWSVNGTFSGNTGTIIFNGAEATVGGTGTQNFNNLIVSASAVTFSNATITLSGNLATTAGGSFSQAAGGTLLMTGSGTSISGPGISLNNLTVSGAVSTISPLTLTGNLSVSGSFTTGAGAITMSGASKTISGTGTRNLGILIITGSITTDADFSISSGLSVNGSLSASAGTATFTGTATLSGIANLFNATINGTSLQLSANSTVGIANVMAIAAGTLDVTSSTPNTVNFNGTGAQNINALTYNNLMLSNGGSKTAIAGITVNNNITIATGTTFVSGAFTHTIYNDWYNYGNFTAGAGTVQFLSNIVSGIYGNTLFNILTVNNANAGVKVLLHGHVTSAIVNMINGIISTGSDTITITNTRTGNGKLLGNVQRIHSFTSGQPYAFEGPNNTITFSSVTSVTSILVSITEDIVGDFPFGGSISETYTVTIPAGTYNATLRLDYEEDELNGNNPSSMTLWNYSGSSWVNIGKTANSTDSGYVEQSGLTNIAGRWTLSDEANHVQWNGSVSSDWNTAANWTVINGSPSRPPSATDIVDIGTALFTWQPTISNSAYAKNIQFGSAQAVTLTIAGGGSLTSGNIKGIWTGNATHSIHVNDQSLTINGTLQLSDGAAGHSINLNIGAGTVSISRLLVESGDANIAFTGAGVLQLSEDFDYSGGTFTAGSGTVVYDGTENQTVGPIAYNNLTINKASGLATIDSGLSIAGNLAITNGNLDNSSTTTIHGNVTISSGAIFRNFETLHIGGDWINNGTYTTSGGNVYFDGTGSQSISPTTFNNLFINKPVGSTATLTGDINLQGNLTVISGSFDVQTYHCDRIIAGGVATLGDSSTFIIASDNAPANFTTNTLSPASTVIFNGTGPQALFVEGITFGNVVFRNTGAKSLVSGASFAGNLTIESGSNFDANHQTITLGGSWINNGTFVATGGVLLLNGLSKTISGNTIFDTVIVSGTYVQTTNATYNDLLSITPTGSISSGGGILTTMNGDLLNRGILNTSGVTTFTGLKTQELSLINATTFALTVNFNGTVSPVLNSTSAPQFGFLNINNTGGVNPSVGWTIVYSLTTGSGASFNGGPYAHNILGAVTNNGTITSSGTLNFLPSSAAAVNLGSNFSSTGTVVLGGTGALTLSGTPAVLNNLTISNINAAGISPGTDWNIGHDFTINSNAIFNAGSHTYTVGGDILNLGTINSGLSTFNMNGTGQQDLQSGSAFHNLTSDQVNGTIFLLSDVTVNGALNFVAGNISTGNYQIVVPATGSVIGAAQNTGWVYGRLKKNISTGATAQTFEIGDSTHFTPVAIAFGNVGTAGDFTATTTAGDHPSIGSSGINGSKSVNRYWTLSNSGAVYDNYTATFNFNAAEVDGGASTSAFGVGLFNGSSWTLPPVTAANSTNIQAIDLTNTGDFAIGQVCNAGSTIAYTASPYCSSAGNVAVTLTGTTGGVFNASADLTINSATGTITAGASAPGTYTVTYTIAASGGCPVYSTLTSVTLTAAPSATINYTGNPYCSDGETAFVTFAGTAGGAYHSAAGPALNATTGNITLGSSLTGAYTITYSIPAAGGCATFDTTASITITTPGTWTGAINTDWNSAGNWLCGEIPGASTNVILPGGSSHYPVIGSGTASVHDLTISSGAGLTVTDATLKIGGSITNNGLFNAGNGFIEMNGSAAQTVPAATFSGNLVNGLTINNNAGLTLQGPLNIAEKLLAANGDLHSNGYLTLLSNAFETAGIDGSGNGEVLDSITVQRYIGAEYGYKYFSSPFQAATVSQFSGEVDLGADFPAFYTYDESLSSAGWVTYTDPSGTLTPLLGYAANLGATQDTALMSIRGVVNNHTVSSPLLYNHDQPYTQGFNLVGNPYPSPINWNAASGWTKTNVDNAVYYFNASSKDQYTGIYSSYINGVSSDGIASNIIPAMQGFFVHVTNGTYPVTGQLVINNNARVINPSVVFLGTPGIPSSPLPLLRLSAGFSDETKRLDPVVFYFKAASTGAFDEKLDALKLMNTEPGIPSLYAVSSDARNLSINALPVLRDKLSIVPLGLVTKKEGWITFNALDVRGVPAGWYIYLSDMTTGENHDLRKDPLYRLYLAAGSYEGRFFLKFSANELTTITTNPPGNDNFRVYSAEGRLFVDGGLAAGETGDLRVINLLGQVVYRQEIRGTGYQPIQANFTPGIYLVNFYTSGGAHVKKIFIGQR